MSYFLSTTLIPFYKTSLTRYFSSKIKFSTISSNVESSDIRPFRISFSTELIKDLRNRLTNTTVLSGVKNLDNSNVINMDFLHKFINYWKDTYNFQEREKYINKYPHFITNIRGSIVHFVHVKPNSFENILHKEKQVVPVLCLHKWFSSIMEFYDFIPLWSTPNKDILFEMIIPSLPGFGFSTSSISLMHRSLILQDLMFKLGYQEFDIQDGNFTDSFMPQIPDVSNNSIIDIYKKIGQELCFFESIRRIPQLSPQTSLETLRELSITNQCRVGSVSEDILAIALRDSPVTLAAYFLERYLKNVNYAEKYNIESLNANSCNKLIDTLMIYWVSQSITTAMKMQAELANSFLSI